MTTTLAAPSPAPPRVVVGIDGSEGSMRALEWAAGEAGRTGAVLEAHASYSPGYVFIAAHEVQESLQQLIDQAADRVAQIAPGVQFKGLTHEETAAKVLIEASEGADLLVVGSRGLGGFSGLLLGSVSHQCSLHAHCPTVIVRPPD